MAGIDAQMGEGLQGSSCSPSQSPNPVINYNQPFGHPHSGDLDDLLNHCQCSIYNPRTSFNLSHPLPNGMSCCHEVVFIYYRSVCDVNGRTYELRYRVEKGGVQTNYMTHQFIWDNNYLYYHGYFFCGWTASFMWPGGSDYDINYVEIYHNGSDYTAFLELWDTVTNTKVADWSQTFTITGLQHTIIYGDIKDYTNNNVKDDIGIKAMYDLPSGTPCAGGIGHCGPVYYRIRNEDSDYIMYVDGMEGWINIIPYKCGYKLETFNKGPVYDKNVNEINFELDATIHGRIIDSDGNPINNANIFTTYGNYGTKTNSDGYYALPYCNSGNFEPVAIKNNFDKNIGVAVSQSGNHPTSTTTRDFTLTRQSDATGEFAHENVLGVFDQSVIIPDDPVTVGTLIQASTVGATTVKARTRKWGTGASLGTSTGPGTGTQQNGSGGYNGEGDMGDGEGWEWQELEPGEEGCVSGCMDGYGEYVCSAGDNIWIWSCVTVPSNCVETWTTSADPGSSPDERIEVTLLTTTTSQASLGIIVYRISDNNVMYNTTVDVLEGNYHGFDTAYRHWCITIISAESNMAGEWAIVQFCYTVTP